MDNVKIKPIFEKFNHKNVTLLISWLGVDSKKAGPKPASIYIASDSRISWGKYPLDTYFDFGKKVFGCKTSPDIFGYCGDVLFPSIVLNQIVELADQGLLFEQNWSCEQKFQIVFTKIKQAFENYPNHNPQITLDSLSIIHASRDKNLNFFCKTMNWTRATGKWTCDEVEFKDRSDKLFVLGSGKNEFLTKFDIYWQHNSTRTSRTVFQCFCDTLFNIQDRYCGGAPQLMGLYRKFDARLYGIIKEHKRYFNGIEVSDLTNFNNIEWRNELFENCDGITMKIKEGAQRQPIV